MIIYHKNIYNSDNKILYFYIHHSKKKGEYKITKDTGKLIAICIFNLLSKSEKLYGHKYLNSNNQPVKDKDIIEFMNEKDIEYINYGKSRGGLFFRIDSNDQLMEYINLLWYIDNLQFFSSFFNLNELMLPEWESLIRIGNIKILKNWSYDIDMWLFESLGKSINSIITVCPWINETMFSITTKHDYSEEYLNAVSKIPGVILKEKVEETGDGRRVPSSFP
jgi:hypothetical protein